MLRIFEQEESERQPQTKLLLDRLQNAATPPPPPPARAAPPAVESLCAAIPPELHTFAEQFTHGLYEVLLAAVRDIQAPAAEDHYRLREAFDLHGKTSLEVEALRSGLNAACERIDSLAQSAQDAQRALENRLEVQAEVIRGLHAGLQAREEELDKVLTAFQALRATSGERPPRRALPEKL